MPLTARENWKDEPDEHDYPAAEDYLSLLVAASKAKQLVRGLRAAPLVHRKAKDLLRASGFAQVDVLHKNGPFAAFGAVKSS